MMKLKKNHEKIKEKISESTRVNLTNPPPTTWDQGKKNRLPKEEHKKRSKLNKKNIAKKNANWPKLVWPTRSRNNKIEVK